MFIKVTKDDGREFHLNVQQIRAFGWLGREADDAKSFVTIPPIDGKREYSELYVKETPQQIDERIRWALKNGEAKANTPSPEPPVELPGPGIMVIKPRPLQNSCWIVDAASARELDT